MVCSVSIKSLIKSLKVSLTILTHQVVEYRIDLTKDDWFLSCVAMDVAKILPPGTNSTVLEVLLNSYL